MVEDRNKYIHCFEDVKALLVRVDPAGLMKGCPDDEYDPEVSRIVIALTKYKLKEEIIREISRDFKDSMHIGDVGKLIGEQVWGIKTKYDI